jgi:hypothetical protein
MHSYKFTYYCQPILPQSLSIGKHHYQTHMRVQTGKKQKQRQQQYTETSSLFDKNHSNLAISGMIATHHKTTKSA